MKSKTITLFIIMILSSITSVLAQKATESILVNGTSTSFFTGEHTTGDCDFYGNGVEVEIGVKVKTQANKVVAYIDATLREGGVIGPRNTKVTISESVTLYRNRDSNRILKDYDLPENTSYYNWTQSGNDNRPHSKTFSSKAFNRVYIVGDGKGCDIGKAGIKVSFPPFYVEVEK